MNLKLKLEINRDKNERIAGESKYVKVNIFLGEVYWKKFTLLIITTFFERAESDKFFLIY